MPDQIDHPTSPPPPNLAPVQREPSAARIGRWLPVAPHRLGRWLLVLLTIALIVWLCWLARAALLPFQIGIIIAYLILPIVNRLERLLPRGLAIVLVYASGLLAMLVTAAFVLPPLVNEASEAIEQGPSLATIQTSATQLFDAYQRTVPEEVREPLEQSVDQAARQMQANLTGYLRDAGAFLLSSLLNVVNTLTFLIGFVIIPFWIFFVVKDQRQGLQAINRMLPPTVRADFWAIVTIIDRVFSSYIRGQLLVGLIVGVGIWVGLVGLNLAGFEIRYALLLAVIAGVTELIPYIGPVLGAIPALAVGFFHSPTTVVAVAILYLVVQQIENHILVPRIIGESVGIHPAVLMVVVIIASQVYGLIGIILAAPLTAVGRDMFVYLYGRLRDDPLPAGTLPASLSSTGALPDTTPRKRMSD